MGRIGEILKGQAKQQIILVAGLILLCAGGGLIMVTARLLDPLESSLLTLAIIVGIVFSLIGTWRSAGPIWLFSGLMILVSGLFLIVMRTAAPSVGIVRIWPFFMIFAGMSVAGAGFMRAKRAKASFLMPAAAFLMLGCIFLPFSLRIVGMSFAQFIKRVWPLFFIAAGVILISLYVGNRIRFSRKGHADGDGI
jgi:hypothetical protein